jgi:hypothetical protein
MSRGAYRSRGNSSLSERDGRAIRVDLSGRRGPGEL